MLDKILMWCGNALMASMLVLLSSQDVVFAQTDANESDVVVEGEVDPDAEPDAEPVVVIPNGGNEPGRIIVPLTGTATATTVNGLQVQPATIDTGVVQIGDSRTQGVTLQHAGEVDAAPIEISNAILFGKNTSEYQTDFTGFVTLYPGDVVDFNVVFTPNVPGTKSAGIRFDVVGATAPHILLFNGWSRYPLTSDLGINFEKVEFGQTMLGSNTTKTFKLTNLGEPDAPVINLNSLEFAGDTPQDFSSNFNPSQIAPGQSIDITVTMSAAGLGTKQSNVTVTHDGNNPPVEFVFEGLVVAPQNVPVNFGKSELGTAKLTRPTTLQFGPDGKLYVGEMAGIIKVFAVVRNGKNNYNATLLETINSINQVKNHDDNGNVNNAVKGRLLTGLHVAGTANAPIIYAASSDPRQAAGPSGKDANLDTNSGILHKLTKNGGGWAMQDMVRGLPRSEENHVSNGLLLHNNKILLNTGGHTNMGVPSNNFAELSEYALSGAVLEIDINQIGNGTYDLPTLDDEDRNGVNDKNDPFGGNDGKNQAILEQNGPVGLYATGYRNAFDITKTESGKIYLFDNGPNPGWGGKTSNNCMNNIDNGGVHHWDNLHLVNKNSYGGHPNPTRGNKNNTFNKSNPQSPIKGPADPKECEYKAPGKGDGALTTIQASSNGLDEFTSDNFLGAMKGDLLVASFNKTIYRLELNAAGTQVTSKSVLINNLGKVPLDLTIQGANDTYPGTIWVADNLGTSITVLEPSDF